MCKLKNKKIKYVIMKKTIIILLFLFLSVAIKAQQNEMYCRGFTTGFYEGYCYLQFPCYRPNLPSCPKIIGIKPTYYVDGYKIGFHEGRIKSVMNN